MIATESPIISPQKTCTDESAPNRRLSITTPFKNAFFCPSALNVAAKVPKEKIPTVATSSEWLDYYNKKQQAKDLLEEEKMERKNKRIEEQIKRNETVKSAKVKKNKTGKSARVKKIFLRISQIWNSGVKHSSFLSMKKNIFQELLLS